MLRFGVKVKMAYCRDNFLAQRTLPDMRRLPGDNCFVFQQDGAPAHRAYDTVAFLERERETQETRRRLYKRLRPCMEHI